MNKVFGKSRPTKFIFCCFSDALENLAWASAQIHCFHSTSKNNGDKTPTIGRTTSLEVTSSDIGDVIFYTKPKILFCDLTIPLGETKTCKYYNNFCLHIKKS